MALVSSNHMVARAELRNIKCVCVHELACICSLKGNASFDFLLITQHALCSVVNCQGPLFFSMESMAGMEWKHILLSSPLSDYQSIIFLSACLTCHILFSKSVNENACSWFWHILVKENLCRCVLFPLSVHVGGNLCLLKCEMCVSYGCCRRQLGGRRESLSAL